MSQNSEDNSGCIGCASVFIALLAMYLMSFLLGIPTSAGGIAKVLIIYIIVGVLAFAISREQLKKEFDKKQKKEKSGPSTYVDENGTEWIDTGIIIGPETAALLSGQDSSDSTPRIESGFANQSGSIADRMITTLSTLEASHEAELFARDNVKGLSEFVSTHPSWFSDHNGRLAALMLFDFLSCYSRLGHNTDKTCAEMYPLLLFLSSLGGSHINHHQRSDDKKAYSQQLLQRLRTFATMTSDDVGTNFGSALTTVMENTGNESMVVNYTRLLYDFALLIANADGYVSSDEMRVINDLKRLANVEYEGDLKTDSLDDTMDQLSGLTGLDNVKAEVEKLVNFIKVQQMRRGQGLKVSPISYHCVFTGSPGTGKTTVARIIANIYKQLGILKKGHLIETDRSGLVAEYVGQTAVKTNRIIDSALDGVLFIDEAYTLAQGGSNDFGSEAIATLLKRMEDDRDRLVVIVAGYDNEIRQFIEMNPGLQSRINRYIHFDDYSADELHTIYCSLAKKHEYVLTDEAVEAAHRRLQHEVDHKDHNFGNARVVRNLFEKTLENQASRLASMGGKISKTQLQEITAADIP
ncbi:MAG: AAA family ATPase [Bacteroides sp.]|nr:AAA family ATPase [Bacteroides sp.]MCM1413585.1 AAA family ATPase [Bacteroides sp.]MCM1471198.1 AAA family ATPase [Bacteroides sp.]